MTNKKVDGYEKYEIESAARTLIEAKEIEGDSKLYPLAKKQLKKQAAAALAAAKEANVEAKVADKLKSAFKE